MKNLSKYIGMNGRISRKQFGWKIYVQPFIGMIPAAFYKAILEENGRVASEDVYFPIFLLLPVFLAISICVRRMHDRNKSGLWLGVYFFLVPLTGILIETYLIETPYNLFGVLGFSFAMVGLIELTLFAGSSGENQYGDQVK